VNVTVRYHGIIGDMLNRKTQQVEMPDGATVTDLLAAVTGGDDDGTAILKQTRAFIDGKQADRATPLADGAEVIFMRPFAGGETIYFDLVDPAGKLSPRMCGSGCPLGGTHRPTGPRALSCGGILPGFRQPVKRLSTPTPLVCRKSL
jgi:molybdopterin converting factor small subunit